MLLKNTTAGPNQGLIENRELKELQPPLTLFKA
jgi:hypothetical protein